MDHRILLFRTVKNNFACSSSQMKFSRDIIFRNIVMKACGTCCNCLCMAYTAANQWIYVWKLRRCRLLLFILNVSKIQQSMFWGCAPHFCIISWNLVVTENFYLPRGSLQWQKLKLDCTAPIFNFQGKDTFIQRCHNIRCCCLYMSPLVKKGLLRSQHRMLF